MASSTANEEALATPTLAMVLEAPGRPLVVRRIALPRVGPGEVAIRVHACGVCRTDLHVVDGELAAKPAVIPGHEVVGDVEELGPGVTTLVVGQRVGVGWLAHTCGACRFCLRGRENLCETARFTGCTVDGGFSERMVARAAWCLPLPEAVDPVVAAPLLCAGAIGLRAWRRVPAEAERVGIYGFGAAAHILTQVAAHEGRQVLAFTRPGDERACAFARSLGAVWAGGSNEEAPLPLDAAIVLAPVGALVPAALAAVDKGGVVVCGGIHMSDIPSFPYRLLWGERSVCSVANLTRSDGAEILRLASLLALRPTTTTYPLTEANRALADLRSGRFVGAAVLVTGAAAR